MEIVEKRWCKTCHSTDIDLIKSNKTVSKKKVSQYFECRDCVNLRARKYYSKNKKRCRLISQRSRIKNQEKQKARQKLSYAILLGKVLRPEFCSSCNKSKPVQGHHNDYSKPLDVVWLCHQCHADVHKFDKN